jgi:hypothetical protein
LEPCCVKGVTKPKSSHFAILHRVFRRRTAFVYSSKPQTVAVSAGPQMKSRASLKKEAIKLEVEEGTGALRSARVMRGKLQDFSFTASAKIEDSPVAPTTGMFLLLIRHSV